MSHQNWIYSVCPLIFEFLDPPPPHPPQNKKKKKRKEKKKKIVKIANSVDKVAQCEPLHLDVQCLPSDI